MRTLSLIALLLAEGASVHARQASSQDARPPMQRPDPARMQAQEADDLAVVLDLKPAQRPALNALLKAAAPPPAPREGGPDGQQPHKAGEDRAQESFLQHLEGMKADLDSRSTEERARIVAVRTFYSGLDQHQQRVFEALERLRHGGEPGHRVPGGSGPRGPEGAGPGRFDGSDGPQRNGPGQRD